MRKYNYIKSLQKGAEPPAIVILLSLFAVKVIKNNGVEITEEIVSLVGAVSTGIYGIYRSVKNYMKNR